MDRLNTSPIHAHCNSDTKQPANYSVHVAIYIVITCLRTVHRPVRIIAHAQAEEVRFADDEVQILVVYLTDALRGPGLCCLRCEVF